MGLDYSIWLTNIHITANVFYITIKLYSNFIVVVSIYLYKCLNNNSILLKVMGTLSSKYFGLPFAQPVLLK